MARLWPASARRRPEPVPRPVEVERVKDDAIRDLLFGFESLGNNCEFGLVQRRYDAEPFGLLRWNRVMLGDLMAALAARFEGVGDPENTELWFSKDGSETFISDKRWGLHMHTFLRRQDVDPDAFFPRACRRYAYLRDRLVEDLEAAEKVFVFAARDIWPGAMLALHAALLQFGPVRLLCIKQAGDDPAAAPLCGKPGQVFEMERGLYIGFLRRIGNTRGRWDIAFDDWVSVCRSLDRAPPLPRAG